MKKRYTLIFSLTDHEARMASGTRNVVKSTRNRLMPSMPTMYSMPYTGIHGVRSINCISPVPPPNWLNVFSDQTNVRAEKNKDVVKRACLRDEEISRSTTAPTTGITRSGVRLVNAPMDITVDVDNRPTAPVCLREIRRDNAGRCRFVLLAR